MFDTLINRSVYCQSVLKGFASYPPTTLKATPGFAAQVVAGIAVCALFGAPAAWSDTLVEQRGAQVAGRVIHGRAPLDQVRIYAIETSDAEWTRTVTDFNGHFLLDQLAPGLYKLIAYKAGYVPAVLLLTRGETGESQFLEIELGELDEEVDADFWSARRAIPQDVLRDFEVALTADPDAIDGSIQNEIGALRTRVQAFTGVDDRVASAVTGGDVSLDGQLGKTRVGVSGGFREFGALSDQIGSSKALTVTLASHGNDVEVTSVRHDLDQPSRNAVAFERHAVGWSRDFGRAGRSRVRAEFTEQQGFYDVGALGFYAPDASRDFELQAEHTTQLTDGHTLTAGLNYRDTSAYSWGIAPDLEAAPRLDLYSNGGVQVQPRVLVQYGLVTTLHDGAVSFVPRGGAVLRLNNRWTASTMAAQRVYSDDSDLFGFRPVLAENYRGCQVGQKSCYQVEFAREASDDQRFAVGATHRQFDETLQLFFDDDLLNRLDTVYLVEGDELPELSVSYTTRLAPGILSRLESNLAIGGGGQIPGVGLQPAENRVQYLVTSFDTYFERSDTGVYVAFQRLEQSVQGHQMSPLDLDKLQLRLTQDLTSLVQLADLAVSVNYELALGDHPNEPAAADELRQRLTGGVALSF